jgi:hypothetical protein
MNITDGTRQLTIGVRKKNETKNKTKNKQKNEQYFYSWC